MQMLSVGFTWDRMYITGMRYVFPMSADSVLMVLPG